MSGSQLSNNEDPPGVLFDQHAPALLAYVQGLMRGDRHAAEDIVQETLLRAWKSADQVPERARRPWLFVTARRLVIDAHRSRRSRPAEVAADLMQTGVDDDGLDSALDSIVVADALRTLSPEHRAVLFDTFYRGQSASQIAAARGVPAGTVRSRMYYALRALRLALHERGVTR